MSDMEKAKRDKEMLYYAARRLAKSGVISPGKILACCFIAVREGIQMRKDELHTGPEEM